MKGKYVIIPYNKYQAVIEKDECKEIISDNHNIEPVTSISTSNATKADNVEKNMIKETNKLDNSLTSHIEEKGDPIYEDQLNSKIPDDKKLNKVSNNEKKLLGVDNNSKVENNNLFKDLELLQQPYVINEQNDRPKLLWLKN